MTPTTIHLPGEAAHGTTTTHFEEQIHPFPNRTNSTVSTSDDIETVDPEKRQESLRKSTSNGLVRTQSVGVDVERAEEEFAQLNRTLSAYSERNRRMSREQSRQYSKASVRDVEKAISSDQISDEEPWDLESSLRGAKAADREAGIKSKRIGLFQTARLTVRC
jgi:ATP-binding cassette, subfamily G (WHITE), member 2, SNQ2